MITTLNFTLSVYIFLQALFKKGANLVGKTFLMSQNDSEDSEEDMDFDDEEENEDEELFFEDDEEPIAFEDE